MTTRRDIVKAGAGLAAIIAAGRAPAALVRSMLGARSIAFGGKNAPPPTARDYVQNGLLALFDAIENSGFGIHDQDATSWANLADGTTIAIPSNWSVYSDYIQVSRINKSILTKLTVDSFTAEYVFALIGTSATRYGILESNTSSSFCFKAGSQVQETWESASYTRNFFSRNDESEIRHHIAASWEDIYGEIRYGSDYLDGTYIGGGKLNIVPSSFSGFRIGRSSTTVATHDICCLRIYNRALTAAEIAANYAVDKARFGLS